MKKTLIIALAALLSAVSCSKGIDEKLIVLTATIEDFETRGTASGSWDGDETVAVRAARGTESEVRQYRANAGGRLDAAPGFTPFELNDSEDKLDITVWYPYSETPSSFAVQEDQSTEEGFDASDFLFASSRPVGTGSKDIVLHHQTSRIIVNITGSDADASGISVTIGKSNLAAEGTFTEPASGAKRGTWTTAKGTASVKPFETTASEGALRTFQALVIPQDVNGKDFICVTLPDGKTCTYTPSGQAGQLAAGGSYRFDVTVSDGQISVAAWSDKTYQASDLKIGDYFYADGTWSDGGLRQITSQGYVWEEPKPSPQSGKTVIGLVFSTDLDRMGQGEKEALAILGTEPHGLVVSTKAVNSNTYVKWYDNNGNYTRDETEIGIPEISSEATPEEIYRLADADIEGYRSNMIIRTERKADLEAGYYPAFAAAMEFASQAGGPDKNAKTTGWYIPAHGQLYDFVRNLTGANLTGSNFVHDTPGIIYWMNLGSTPAKLNELMSKIPAGSKSKYEDYNNALWSASQGGDQYVRYIDFTASGYLDSMYDTKNKGGHIRCVLAF